MTFEEVMNKLESLATDQMRKIYDAHGVRQPFWGVPTTAMRPLARKIKRNQLLAEQLYATGNYDAMYFAGMVADPAVMTPDDFERWMNKAYFYMLADWVVAVSLAETSFAQEIADRWIESGEELRMSAGWSCYQWLLGNRSDSEFDTNKLRAMVQRATNTIHSQPNRTRYSMNGFIIAVGIHYLPLHNEALEAAEKIGKVTVSGEKNKCSVQIAAQSIKKAAEQNRLGFKRKGVRC